MMHALRYSPDTAPRMEPRRTAVICTIGPASRTPRKLISLIEAGMNVARLHFSYADQKEHGANIERIRRAEATTGVRVAILQDLSGTKVRLREFIDGTVTLKPGASFTLTNRKTPGDASTAGITVPELLPVIKPGDTVLLADGVLRLQAVKIRKGEVRCEAVVGGRLKSHQAVHVLGKSAPVRVPTRKDLEDVAFGIRHGVDWIAQSFATSAREINTLRSFIRKQGASIPVIAKIERCAALKNLEEIIQAADAIMVARGDLGLDFPVEQIALAQKHIIRHANAAGKPVITATEMLFSMMDEPRPTRADVADITNAILDGSDAVMLSGETGIGKFPVEATSTMARIAAVTDQYRKQIEGPDWRTRSPFLPDLESS